ncbi:MAG: hypothetical protein SNJ70_08115 [Armatimonadota bacterium]
MPCLDGVVLTFHETAQSIYNDNKVATKLPHGERVAYLIDHLGAVCSNLGKTMFIRTFAYEPEELGYIREGINMAKADFIVMSKEVPHDWQPYYPNNPLIGAFPEKKQVIEFDLGHEYLGLARVPYINIDYVVNRLNYGISKNMYGAVLRIERLKWRTVDTPNQATIDVFTKMLSDTTLVAHKLYKNWLENRYGKEAVPYLFSAFMRTEEITDKALFTLGFWVSDHSLLPDYDYAIGHMKWLTTAKWDPNYKKLEQELFNPTRKTLQKIADEKDKAMELVEASIEDINKAKPYLSDADYDELMMYFSRSKAMVTVWKYAMLAIYGIDVYNNTKDNQDRRALLNTTERMMIEVDRNRLELIDMASHYCAPNHMAISMLHTE